MATRATRGRYAQLPAVAPFAGAATVFMSHCWAARWGDLVLAAAHGAAPDRVVRRARARAERAVARAPRARLRASSSFRRARRAGVGRRERHKFLR